jgi:hypothetical protein
MLHDVDVNWADLEPKWKNGTFLFRDEREWKSLHGLVLTRDERPVIGSVFDYLIWHKDKTPYPTSIDVFNIEK